MEIINIMYFIDYELKFKSWQSYVELPFGLSFLMDEFELEHYFSKRITFLKGFDATEFSRLMYKEMPKTFRDEQYLNVSESWNSDLEIAQVRKWLFQKKIPFDQDVYMLYDENVIKTKWKVFVKHWDIFSWSVGISLNIVDQTRSWMLEVHHENVMTFYSMESVRG